MEVGAKGILVNERMETSVRDIYAIGDVKGIFMLAHTASREGIVAAENICGHTAKIDYRKVASCIYVEPELHA